MASQWKGWRMGRACSGPTCSSQWWTLSTLHQRVLVPWLRSFCCYQTGSLQKTGQRCWHQASPTWSSSSFWLLSLLVSGSFGSSCLNWLNSRLRGLSPVAMTCFSCVVWERQHPCSDRSSCLSTLLHRLRPPRHPCLHPHLSPGRHLHPHTSWNPQDCLPSLLCSSDWTWTDCFACDGLFSGCDLC